MNKETREPFEEPKSPMWRFQRACLFPLMTFTGSGIGALLALVFGRSSWPDARLFILSGAAIGLGLASVLAPNLLSPKHREASAPKQ